MQSADAAALVDAYLDALAAHDYEGIRAMLCGERFHYESPIACCDGADDYLNYLMMTAGILRRIERLIVFASGGDVCHWLQVETQLSDRVSTRIAQWTKVAGGQITRVEMLFDPYRYRLLFDTVG
jgi:hypothetical protein